MQQNDCTQANCSYQTIMNSNSNAAPLTTLEVDQAAFVVNNNHCNTRYLCLCTSKFSWLNNIINLNHAHIKSNQINKLINTKFHLSLTLTMHPFGNWCFC